MVAFFNPPPFMKSGGAPPTLSFNNYTSVNNAQASGHSWTMNFGPEAPGRLVVIAYYYARSGGSITPVPTAASIGGVPATIGPGLANPNYTVYLMWAVVPTGTSGTVSVSLNFTLTANCIRCGSYSIYGLNSPTRVAQGGSSGGAVSIQTVSGGVMIAASIGPGGEAMSGSGVVTDYNSQGPTVVLYQTGGRIVGTPDAVSTSISKSNYFIVGASWR